MILILRPLTPPASLAAWIAMSCPSRTGTPMDATGPLRSSTEPSRISSLVMPWFSAADAVEIANVAHKVISKVRRVAWRAFGIPDMISIPPLLARLFVWRCFASPENCIVVRQHGARKQEWIIQFDLTISNRIGCLSLKNKAAGETSAIRRLRPKRSWHLSAQRAVRKSPQADRVLRSGRLSRLSHERASRDDAEHDAVTKRLPGCGGAANQAFAPWRAGLCAARAPAAAAGRRDLHGRSSQ